MTALLRFSFFLKKDYTLQRIDLSEWYKPLVPGHYQLTVKRQFVRGGDWIQSDSINFDITRDD